MGENNSVLLFRESVTLKDERGPINLSHWELPKGKINRGEDRLSAAQRIVYSKSGLLAETVEELFPKPTRFQRVVFQADHHYFVARSTQGIFSRAEYVSGKEGRFQWIEYDHLSCYAIRRETVSMLQLAFEGPPK